MSMRPKEDKMPPRAEPPKTDEEFVTEVAKCIQVIMNKTCGEADAFEPTKTSEAKSKEELSGSLTVTRDTESRPSLTVTRDTESRPKQYTSNVEKPFDRNLLPPAIMNANNLIQTAAGSNTYMLRNKIEINKDKVQSIDWHQLAINIKAELMPLENAPLIPTQGNLLSVGDTASNMINDNIKKLAKLSKYTPNVPKDQSTLDVSG